MRRNTNRRNTSNLTKKTSIVSKDHEPGYEIGVTVMGVTGITGKEGLVLPGKTGKRQSLKAVVGFLSSKTEKVIATSGLSREISYSPLGAVIASTEFEKATEGSRRFHAAWDDSDSSLRFESGQAKRRFLRLCIAIADSAIVAKNMLVYPIGVSSFKIDMTSENDDDMVVDVPVNFFESDSNVKPINLKAIHGQSSKQGNAKKWIGKRMSRGFSFIKRKASLKKEAGHQNALSNEDSTFTLSTKPVEQMLVRLKIRVEKKDAGIEVALSNISEEVELDNTLPLDCSMDTSISLPDEEISSDMVAKSKRSRINIKSQQRTLSPYSTERDAISNEKVEESKTFDSIRNMIRSASSPGKFESSLCGALTHSLSIDQDDYTFGDTTDMSSGILASPSSVSNWSQTLNPDQATDRRSHDDKGLFMMFPRSLMSCLPSYTDILRAAEKTAYSGYPSTVQAVPSLVEADTFFSRGNQTLSIDPTLTMDSGIYSLASDIKGGQSLLPHREDASYARVGGEVSGTYESEENSHRQPETNMNSVNSPSEQ